MLNRQRRRANFTNPEKTSQYFGAILFLFILTILLVAGGVQFYNVIHYDNLLGQANLKTASAQAALNQEQTDAIFIISNSSGQINCDQLLTNYDRSLCNAHDKGNL